MWFILFRDETAMNSINLFDFVMKMYWDVIRGDGK
jgi:hypothetical protein